MLVSEEFCRLVRSDVLSQISIVLSRVLVRLGREGAKDEDCWVGATSKTGRSDGQCRAIEQYDCHGKQPSVSDELKRGSDE